MSEIVAEAEKPPAVVREEIVSPAEEAKKLGNDAFLAKNYLEAIKHYSEAIKLDPENAVYYSNRSACYALLKEWQKAYEDALLCVSKDAKFIKGYYRLSSAQIELQQFKDAEATLIAATTIEPDNEVIKRQLKNLKAKRDAVAAKNKKPAKKLDEAQLKELMELQEQTNVYSRDLRGIQSRVSSLQREARLNSVTTSEVQSLAEATPLYRAVGKAFVLTSRGDIEKRLDKDISFITKTQRDLLDRQEYLERRIKSNTENMRDLAGGM